ncbi:GntR family transcriptional regulator [Devosia pacifica]|uniref:GntR family transcriptional regulator n=1 Tax=Devosia pacifica TaxID=1335967 RepID=A0A918S1E0_9HYPH|nr:GntR family transcriptional regulator [Devosia pacifica]GHA19084.1 GntR family transcriptional regulator [Devosia pacifica]
MTSRRNEAQRGPIQRPPRLGEEVYSAIYSQLMTLQIPPGGRISVDSLVRDLGVSQTPIREALSRLEAQGLVTKTHLVGYSATNQIDRKKLEQLYELRLLLEPHAAARAAINMSEEELADLEQLANDMKTPPEDNGDPRTAYSRFARNDAAFHDKIAEGSGNELVQEALARLYIHVHLFRLYYHTLATATANAEHKEIIRALKRRAPQDAENAMREHILRSRERFIVAV